MGVIIVLIESGCKDLVRKYIKFYEIAIFTWFNLNILKALSF